MESAKDGEELALAAVLGDRIQRLREARGWSRVELARKLGVSRERLSKWERGENRPPLEVLSALGRLLGVTLDELVTGESGPEGILSLKDWEELVQILTRMGACLRRLGFLGDGGEWS